MNISTLRHLDLKRVTDEERIQCSLMERDALEINKGVRRGEESSTGEALGGETERDGTVVDARNDSSQHPTMNSFSHSTESAQALDPTPQILKFGSRGSDGKGLVSLARQGKLPAAQSLFDIEILGANDKALVVVGDSWDWIIEFEGVEIIQFVC